MPNMIAWGALLIWPVVTVILFATLGARKGIVWSLVAAYMLLPVNVKFNPPGMPDLDKTSLPNLAAFICAMIFASQSVVKMPRSPIVLLLMILFVFSPMATVFGNPNPIILSRTALPGMSLYDGLSACALQALELLPFILGYTVLQRDRDHLMILRVLVVAGLAYSIPILFESRFAPVLHQRLYGIASFSDFTQMIRFGGYRPSVFMGHGLLVSMFCSMAVIAAVILWRLRLKSIGLPAALVALYLIAILVLMKSVGAVLLTVFGLVALKMLSPRRLVLGMLIMSIIIVLYPTVRASGIIPTKAAIEAAGLINDERAGSLSFRLENEDRLLDHANKKPLFGWGGWGRNQVFEQQSWGDVRASTTDGRWIIAIGQFGWVGYVALFGLLCHPFWRAYREGKGRLSLPTLGLLLILMLNLMDLIPNSSLRPLTWLIAGALSGMILNPRPKPKSSSVFELRNAIE